MGLSKKCSFKVHSADKCNQIFIPGIKFILLLFHMVNSVTYMNVRTSLEKAIKRVLNKL